MREQRHDHLPWLIVSLLPGQELGPAEAGPVPDKLTIWPMETGYGIDATFQGASGYERAEWHQHALKARGIKYQLRQELDGGWTLRLGPGPASAIALAVSAWLT